MSLGFRKDIFSKSKISWSKEIDKKIYKDINYIVKTYISTSDFNIKKNKGLEINSNNFKIEFKSQSFLLKKWNKNMKIIDIEYVLNLMIWLKNKKIPVQMPQYFSNKKYFIKYKNDFWSFFNFIDGDHFKGNINELKNVAKYIGQLSTKLQKYPNHKHTNNYKYFSFKDYKVLNKMNSKNFDLEKKFGKKDGKIIKNYLPEIMNLFEKLKNFDQKKYKKKMGHLDLHPHNIITKNNMTQAFLDIGSCRIIQGEQHVAYGALKLCKQAVVNNKKRTIKRKVINKFINIFEKEYYLKKNIKKNLYYFAVSEVLRRLIYIFRLSIEYNNRKWNKIIPIQLGHLDECKEFFLVNKIE
tara:strand:- start:560 stop:1618 length:1059 start_codon:yes stop_codon:yes gene_type:complete